MKNKPLLFISVIFGFLMFYGVGFAASPSDLKVQIQNLLKQIEELQKKLKESEGGGEEWCFDFNKNLRVGDKGGEIDMLNTALVKEYFLEEEIIEHSNNFQAEFTEETAAAVVGFQEKYADEILKPNGLKHGTGFVGKSTRAKLNRLYGCDKSKNEEKTQSFEGILTLQGAGINMWGSHKIKVNNVSYFVQAGNSRVFSDLKKNENKKVKIIGTSRYYDLEGGFWGITAEKAVSE